NERKRKFREEVGDIGPNKIVDEGEFRERVAREREEKRLEAIVTGAQKVAEGLDTDAEVEEAAAAAAATTHDDNEDNSKTKNGGHINDTNTNKAHPPKHKVKPLSQTNVLYRGLLRQRVEKERERRARYDLHQSLSRLPTYEDPDEEQEDKRAIGREDKQ
ncbi:MAG: hypothetical protein M4579_007742, partial [Chaenotheca gracillima]